MITRLKDLFKPNPHRKAFEELRYCGISQDDALDIIEYLPSDPQEAEVELAAAVEFAKAGVRGHEIHDAIALCRRILESEHIVSTGRRATRDQLLATVQMVASVSAYAGRMEVVLSIVWAVSQWKLDAL